MNMRNQIPKWCWLNGLFIHNLADSLETDPDMSISSYHEAFCKELDGFQFPLKNQGFVISMLYSMLVIPREMWENDRQIRSEFAFTTSPRFTAIEGKWNDSWCFLRLMRNAIAHAHFELNEQGVYHFWNINKQDIMDFKVSVMHSDLFAFIKELRDYFLNKYPQ